jgi:hypothetical protein
MCAYVPMILPAFKIPGGEVVVKSFLLTLLKKFEISFLTT